MGGGVFRRTIGSTPEIVNKEKFNRQVQNQLFLDNSNAKLLGIGIDLNLEAEDEGFSAGVLIRNMLLILALAALTGAMLKSWRVGAVALSGLATLFVWILGFPVLAGSVIKTSLMIQVILPLAFMAIGIDFFIYATTEYEHVKQTKKDTGDNDSISYLTTAVRGVSIALLLAGISNAIAFGANYVSPVEAVQSFALTGIFAACASFIVMGIFAPLLLSIWDEWKPRSTSSGVEWSLKEVVDNMLNHKALVVGILLVATTVSILGIFRIQRGVTPQDFISSDSDFVKSLNVRDANWEGIRGERASIFVTGNLNTQQARQALDQTMGNLQNNQYLAHIPDSNDLVLPLGGWRTTELPGSNSRAALLVVEVSGTRNLTTVTQSRKAILEDLQPLKELANDYGVTGSPFTREASLNAVTNSLTKTFMVAALLVLIMLLGAFRSLKYALITITPIVFVTLWTYGLMGVAGFKLNFVTVTIAAVSFGVGIDYAIHIVQSFRQKRKQADNAREALLEVADTTMRASLTAFISSTVGFLILATAPMPMFATYGILGAVMITFAFASVLLLLPLILSKVKT